MPPRIVVFGATGYTGEHTARALVARGASPVLAARSKDKLEALASELGGLETLVADVSRPESVKALVARGDVLLSTVGPFARWGEPAVAAAIEAGATYIDSTGEPAFIRRVFDEFGPRAAHAGSGLLTAFGYDWVPGNLAGGLALRDAGDSAVRVEVGYFGGNQMSGGTRASIVQATLGRSFAYRGGTLRTEPAGRRVGSFELPGKGSRTAISVGGTEHFGLPEIHPGLRDVDVMVGQHGPHVRAMPLISQAMNFALSAPGVRTRMLDFAAGRVKGSTGGPDEQARAGSKATVMARAFAPSGEQLSEVTLEGVNPYTFTFEILAWGAIELADGRLLGRGAVSPVEAFELDQLEEGVGSAGIERSA